MFLDVGGGENERTDVPSLCEEYAQAEKEKEDSCAGPSVGCEWCGLVEVGLEQLQAH